MDDKKNVIDDKNSITIKGPPYNSYIGLAMFFLLSVAGGLAEGLAKRIPMVIADFTWLVLGIIIIILFVGIAMLSPTNYIVCGTSKNIYHNYLYFFTKKIISVEELASIQAFSKDSFSLLSLSFHSGRSFFLNKSRDSFHLKSLGKNIAKLLEIPYYDSISSPQEIEAKEDSAGKVLYEGPGSAMLLSTAIQRKVMIKQENIPDGYLYRVKLSNPGMNQDHPALIFLCIIGLFIVFPFSMCFIPPVLALLIPVLALAKLIHYFFFPRYIDFRITKNTLSITVSGGKEFELPVSEIDDISAVHTKKEGSVYPDIYLGISMKQGHIYKIENRNFEALALSSDLIKATLNELG